jgi:hypothetical protein
MRLRSALLIGTQTDEVWSIEMKMAMKTIRDLAVVLEKDVEVTFQHQLQRDLFAVMVETDVKTFSGVSENFHSAFVNLRHEIEKYLRGLDELQQEEKPAPREASSKGSGRRRTTRKRVNVLRQGGRASSR